MTPAISESKHKLRKTFFTTINCGIYENGLHPLSALHLYKTIVLPKALYGCELWSSLTSEHILMLEIAHRFCIKYIQNISNRSRTDVALNLLGLLPIEAEIDRRKLVFLGQLCNLRNDNIIKEIFVNRLTYYLNFTSKATGFVPDIYRICKKYNLLFALDSYVSHGNFPCKATWKRIIDSNIMISHMSTFQSRVNSDVDLNIFQIVQSEQYGTPSHIWLLSKNDRSKLKYSQIIVKLINRLFSRPYITNCIECNRLTDNIVIHVFLYCPNRFGKREIFWMHIYECFGKAIFSTIMGLPPLQQLLHLMSGLRNFVSQELETESLTVTSRELYRLYS